MVFDMEVILTNLGKFCEVLWSVIQYKIDLSIIGFGKVSLMGLLAGGLGVAFLVYKFIRWII